MKKLLMIIVLTTGFSLQAQQVQTCRQKMSCAQLCKSALFVCLGMQAAQGTEYLLQSKELCINIKGFNGNNQQVYAHRRCFRVSSYSCQNYPDRPCEDVVRYAVELDKAE